MAYSAFSALRKSVELLLRKLKADTHRREDTPSAPPPPPLPPHPTAPPPLPSLFPAHVQLLSALTAPWRWRRSQTHRSWFRTFSLPRVCSPPPDRDASGCVFYSLFIQVQSQNISSRDYLHVFKYYYFLSNLVQPPAPNVSALPVLLQHCTQRQIRLHEALMIPQLKVAR